MLDSFDFITSRNNKKIQTLFKLNGCRYFTAVCYVDYLYRIGILNEYEKNDALNTFNQLPYHIHSFNLKNHNLYAFDSSFNMIRGNNPIVCYIYKKTYDGINSIHTFILDVNIIYNSWYVTESVKNKNKKYIIDELTGKRKYNDEQEVCAVLMSPKKVIVNNVYEKLNQLLEEPSLNLLNELFGLSEKDILTNSDWLNDFKDASFIYVKLNV